ncbi:hypothetical protein PgNI_11205, partial [Pyricularia grisea]|uniref:Uncharacterized protein n=1 Tax=Pyricularia grisea TaxID=148305 RepID=A0A6P8AQ48_PYRGI
MSRDSSATRHPKLLKELELELELELASRMAPNRDMDMPLRLRARILCRPGASPISASSSANVELGLPVASFEWLGSITTKLAYAIALQDNCGLVTLIGCALGL